MYNMQNNYTRGNQLGNPAATSKRNRMFKTHWKELLIEVLDVVVVVFITRHTECISKGWLIGTSVWVHPH